MCAALQVGMPKVVATVIAARNLPVTEKFGRATPYMIMAIGNSFHKTTPAATDSNPTWANESFEFAVQPALMQAHTLHTLTHIHTHSLSLFLCLSRARALSLSLSLSYTHTYMHTHAHEHSH